MEEAERSEEEEEEMAMTGEGLGFCAIGFERKKEFCHEEEPIRGEIK